MTQTDTLTTKQRAAIPVLLATPSPSKAAEILKIGRATLHRWMRQDEFKTALREAEQDSLEALHRAMVGHAVQPLVVLIEVMNDKKQPGGVRVRAAAAFLGILLRYRELVTLEARLEAIEEALKVRQE